MEDQLNEARGVAVSLREKSLRGECRTSFEPLPSEGVLRHHRLADAPNAYKVRVCNELAALVYGIDIAAWSQRIRSERRLTEARQQGMYLANVCFGLGFEEIAEEITRDRTTVRYGVEKVEDRRENPHFEGVVLSLETLLACLVDRDVSDTILGGLDIDHDLIAYIPRANSGASA